MINLEEVKKKYFIQSACEIFVGKASEIKTLFTVLEQQQSQLEKAYKELAIANEKIRELKNLRLVKKNMQLEEQNLELDKTLRAANQEVERLLVVEKAYAAYKKAY